MNDELQEKIDYLLYSTAILLYSSTIGTLTGFGVMMLSYTAGEPPAPSILLSVFLGAGIAVMTALDQAQIRFTGHLLEDKEVELTDGK